MLNAGWKKPLALKPHLSPIQNSLCSTPRPKIREIRLLESHGWKNAGLANLDLKQLIRQLMAAAGKSVTNSQKNHRLRTCSHFQTQKHTQYVIPNAITTPAPRINKRFNQLFQSHPWGVQLSTRTTEEKNNRQQFYAL